MTALALETTVAGAVAIVRLASPERANAMGPGDMARLAEAVRQAAVLPGVRALILTGKGKSFSAGAMLGDLDAIDAEAMADVMIADFAAIDAAITRSPVPVIAAINGACAGAAVGLALLADVAIASDTARLLFPFATLGLVPDTGIAPLLAAQLGVAGARALLMQAGQLDAAQALAAGLVVAVVEAQSLEAEALANRCADMPAGVHSAIRALLLAEETRRAAHYAREAQAQAARLANPETRAAIARVMAAHTPSGRR